MGILDFLPKNHEAVMRMPLWKIRAHAHLYGNDARGRSAFAHIVTEKRKALRTGVVVGNAWRGLRSNAQASAVAPVSTGAQP